MSEANNVSGGGLPPQRDLSRTAVRYPHPALRATLPTRGRDKGTVTRPQSPLNLPRVRGLKRASVQPGAVFARQGPNPADS